MNNIKNIFKKQLVLIVLLLITTKLFPQAGTTVPGQYDNLSLEDLLNVKIVSASKKNESLFDSPLSASVLTREEIQRSGSNSIMEALRLLPGLIVRQQTNGNYDIHIRGLDNIPPNASFDIASTTTLVMIDNRPIYSYLRGGTFWETLPVDLNDVEKIEVVRGPAAALYGPNAVNGVINIITRKAAKKGLYLLANNQQGSLHTFINNASIGYKAKKWSVIASGNYQDRERSQTSYFEFNRNKWLQDPSYFIKFSYDTAFNVKERYPDQRLAMNKYAGNMFLSYKGAEKVKLNLSAGTQHSMVQKVSSENEVSPLSTAASNSSYIDISAGIMDLSAQLSYNRGTQNVDYDPGNKYDFNVFDATVEYSYSHGNLLVRPALSYRNAVYDDTKYSDLTKKAGIFNTRGNISTSSASLRSEYKMMDDKLRLVAGFMTSKFNYPDKTYISYEFAGTYKLNKKHLLRAVYSQAPRSSNIFDTYVDQTIAFYPSGYKKFTRMGLFGNKDLKMLTANMFELGYRGIINSRFNIDVELFNISVKNTNLMISARPYTQLTGTDTLITTPIIATNLPLRVTEQGITVSLNYTSKKLQVKPFITVQKTKIKDYAPYNNTADAGMGPDNIYSGMGTEVINKSTPPVFGGVSVNFTPAAKININLNSYYYSKQTYYHLSNVLFHDGIRGIDNIDAKLILNASVSYEAMKGLRFFGTAENLLNDKSREFFKADAVPFMLKGGMHYEF